MWKKWAELLAKWLQRRNRRYLLEPGESDMDPVHDFLVEKGDRLVEERRSDGAVILAFKNFLISRYRKRKRQPPMSRLEGDVVAPAQADSASTGSLPPCEKCLEIMRSLGHGRGSAVDRGAVLLLHARTYVALRCARTGRVTAQKAVSCVEQIYPWTAEDAARRPRKDLPPIGELWLRVAEKLRDATLRKIADLAACVGVDACLWAKWVERALHAVLEEYGPEVIAKCFGHWPRRSDPGRRQR